MYVFDDDKTLALFKEIKMHLQPFIWLKVLYEKTYRLARKYILYGEVVFSVQMYNTSLNKIVTFFGTIRKLNFKKY